MGLSLPLLERVDHGQVFCSLWVTRSVARSPWGRDILDQGVGSGWGTDGAAMFAVSVLMGGTSAPLEALLACTPAPAAMTGKGRRGE